MKKKLRQFLIILLVLLVVLAVAGLAYRSAGHRALEKYVAELRDKGEKLTLRELSATLSTNVNDAESVLTNVAQKLGPPPRSLDELVATALLPYSYSEPGRVKVTWRDVPSFSISPRGGATASWTDLSNAVAAIDPSLEELRQAMKQPSPNTGPRANKLAPASPDTTRNAAAWLAVATLTELHNGRRAEALADLQALTGLAGLNREEYDRTNQSTRIAVIHAGVELTWQALQAADWSDDQLVAMQRCWQNLDALDALQRCVEGERAESLEIFARISERQPASYANASAGDYVPLTLDRMNKVLLVETLMERDLLFRLQHTHAEVEAARSLQSNRAWKEAAGVLEQRDSELEKKAHAPQHWFYSLSVSSLPDLKPVFIQGVRAETERRLLLTAIALKRYKLKYNRVPPSLESLGADYLPLVPRDPMNTLALRYQANTDGTFSLYSVGVDGKDNGGDPSSSSSGGKPGLWEGRDAVWPWPGK